jgi:hypothetical protein
MFVLWVRAVRDGTVEPLEGTYGYRMTTPGGPVYAFPRSVSLLPPFSSLLEEVV